MAIRYLRCFKCGFYGGEIEIDDPYESVTWECPKCGDKSTYCDLSDDNWTELRKSKMTGYSCVCNSECKRDGLFKWFSLKRPDHCPLCDGTDITIEEIK